MAVVSATDYCNNCEDKRSFVIFSYEIAEILFRTIREYCELKQKIDIPQLNYRLSFTQGLENFEMSSTYLILT